MTLQEKLQARYDTLNLEINSLELENVEAIRRSDWMKAKDINNHIYEQMGRRAGIHEAIIMAIYNS